MSYSWLKKKLFLNLSTMFDPELAVAHLRLKVFFFLNLAKACVCSQCKLIKLDIKETSVVVILSNCLRFTLRSASTIWELSPDWFDSRSHQAAPTAYIDQTTLRREHQSAGIWAAYDFQHCPCQHIKKLLECLPQLTRNKKRENIWND